jgi:hypothetical protein
VGAGRSGTTLLRLMLNEHPALAIPSESHFVAPLFRRFGPTATLQGAALEAALAIVLATAQWQEDFGHTEAELRAAVGTGPLSMGELVDRVFRLEVGPAPARWGDKTPMYLHWVDGLLACFPDAQVMAIVRDPRDVYLSLVPLGWFGTTTWDIGRYLARNGRLVAEWSARFGPDRFSVVRYEDLVLETERTLRGVCATLGLPFVAEMQAFFHNAEQHVPARELAGVHTKLLRPPSAADVGRWRREGSRLEHAEIESLTAPVIDAYGYERRLSDRALGVVRAEARARHHVRAPGAVAARTAGQLARRARRLLDRASAGATTR